MLTADRSDSTGRTRSASPFHPRCRRLFHAAPRTALPAILRAGLIPHDVALTPTVGFAAVWLTDDAQACADLGNLELRPAERAMLGFDPCARLRAPAEVAPLAVRVPADDRRLVPWASWAPRHLPPVWCAVLARFGAVRTRTWFLYRGPIPAAWIAPSVALPSRPGAGAAATLAVVHA